MRVEKSDPKRKMKEISAHWMRRDLRLEDNRALAAAAETGNPIFCVFIFDQEILSKLDNPEDVRVAFIHRELTKIKQRLNEYGGDLWVEYGAPMEAWARIESALTSRQLQLRSVSVGRDYEPYAQERDRSMLTWFTEKGIEFSGVKDHVIFEKSEVVKGDGLPYTVFTPYSRKWRNELTDAHFEISPSLKMIQSDCLVPSGELSAPTIPTLASMGFEDTQAANTVPAPIIQPATLKNYGEQRDYPALDGTTRLSVHLRFGTISIRAALRQGLAQSEKWTTELIWRDFYQMIIYHFPHAAANSFRPAYDQIPWLNDEVHFQAWCEGRTGYPLVDAGMRELVATGFMHNRVRMVVASFLCKHLLIDWRWGERFFARHLLDFDLASNSGGWQWAAGSGCDAAPYFRVFNPTAQLEKFDKQMEYVKHWVPEWGTSAYPEPIVDHAMARVRAIETYQSVLKPRV